MKKVISLFTILTITFSCFGFFITGEAVSTSAKAAILIDAESGRVLYEHNAYTKLPMASTTKIMTTLLAVERGNLDKQFKVDDNAIKVEGSSMGLKSGDLVTLRALCFGMMLPSGNDAANATAVRIAGSIEKFVAMMNKRANELGLKSTHFVTPSGLDDYTDDHYSTASDMAKLTAYALKNSIFAEICSTRSAKLKYGNPPYERWLANTNKLMASCEGVIGVKTGFTDKARRCLVSACRRNGTTLICVTLNDRNDWADHSDLYDFGFSQYKSVTLSPETKLFKAPLVGAENDTVTASCENEIKLRVYKDDEDKISQKVILNKINYAPISEGEILGYVKYYLNNRCVGQVKIKVNKSVNAKDSERTAFDRFITKVWRLI